MKSVKKFLSLLLTGLMTLALLIGTTPLPSFAAETKVQSDITIGNLVYDLYEDTAWPSRAVVKGLASGTTVVVPASVDDSSKTYPIKEIDVNAFKDKTALTSLDLSGASNLVTIGSNAFDGCTSLASTLTIPSSVSSIGASAFASSAISGLNLAGASSLLSIGDSAFSGCASLAGTLRIPANMTSIASSVFKGTAIVTLDFSGANGLGSIGASAFEDTAALLGTVTLPRNVTTIGDSSFEGSGLESLAFAASSNLASIGVEAFFDCANLTGTIVFPANLTTIGTSCFEDTDLEDLDFTLATNLVTIGNSSFADCTELRNSIVIPSKVTTIGDSAFANANISALDLVGSSNLVTIGASSFLNCTQLGVADISGAPNLTTIEPSAFAGCTALTFLDFTGVTSLTSIKNGAFNGCTALDTIDYTGCVSITNIEANNDPLEDASDKYSFSRAAITKVLAYGITNVELCWDGIFTLISTDLARLNYDIPLSLDQQVPSGAILNMRTYEISLPAGRTFEVNGSLNNGKITVLPNGRLTGSWMNSGDTVDIRYAVNTPPPLFTGQDAGLTFAINGEHARYDNITVGGTTLTSLQHSTVSGSTVVTLQAAYLKTLPKGVHNVVVNFADGGWAALTFQSDYDSLPWLPLDPSLPTGPGGGTTSGGSGGWSGSGGSGGSATGDSNTLALGAALAMAVALAGMVVLRHSKKKNANKGKSFKSSTKE